MKTAHTRISESDARLNIRLAIVTAVLLTGALLSCFPIRILAADLWPRQHHRLDLCRRRRALDRNYTTLGGTLGYMISEGLMLGVSAETWFGNDPTYTKLRRKCVTPSPGRSGETLRRRVRLAHDLRRPSDRKHLRHARRDLHAVSSNAAFNVGVVYERISDCDASTYKDCSQLYPRLASCSLSEHPSGIQKGHLAVPFLLFFRLSRGFRTPHR